MAVVHGLGQELTKGFEFCRVRRNLGSSELVVGKFGVRSWEFGARDQPRIAANLPEPGSWVSAANRSFVSLAAARLEIEEFRAPIFPAFRDTAGTARG